MDALETGRFKAADPSEIVAARGLDIGAHDPLENHDRGGVGQPGDEAQRLLPGIKKTIRRPAARGV